MDYVINDTVINALFDGYILDKTIRHYCITYKGKIIMCQGKMLYDTKQQATKAFYNMFRWRLGAICRRVYNLNWDQWSSVRGCTWKNLKDAIKDDLKIIEV